MQIQQHLEFPADPKTVLAMLTDKSYLEQVAKETEASSYDVNVDGLHTKTERSFEAPAAAAKFTGPLITVLEDTHWAQPGADGRTTSTLTLSVKGVPATMSGQGILAPGGKGTTVSYTGELHVNVPFIGKKLEQQAAPAVTAAIQAQQRVGLRWLAEHD